MSTGSRDGGTKAFVEVRGLTKTYGSSTGDVAALRDVSFDVARGEFLAVLGPSGCGKSTLLSIVAGLEPATGGSAHVDGRPVSGPYPGLGMVHQQDMLLPWRTALRNVTLTGELRRMPVRDTDRRARDLLDLMGLEDFVDKYPAELSGGMRQRVALCRALLHDPTLLLLDEPFGALDALTREQLNIDLQRMHEERLSSVILVTHSIAEAVFLADRVVLLSPAPGEVVEDLVVTLPRPRSTDIMDSTEFTAMVRRIREIFASMGVLGRRGSTVSSPAARTGGAVRRRGTPA